MDKRLMKKLKNNFKNLKINKNILILIKFKTFKIRTNNKSIKSKI